MRNGTPPSLDDILELAETALSAIPEELRNLVGGTVMAAVSYTHLTLPTILRV